MMLKTLLSRNKISLKCSLKRRGLVLSSKHIKLGYIKTCLEKITKGLKSQSKMYTGRKLQAAILHGPCNLKIEEIPETTVQPHQIRVDVYYCAVTENDVLLWARKHFKIPDPHMVLGFEVTGKILEMGKLAYEKTGYQKGEEVVLHSYPDCGGFAETCLAHYRDVFRLARRVTMKSATAIIEDYFSSFLALGRRTRIQKDEYFLVNTSRSRTALAVIDLATRVFCAKAIVICNSRIREELCYNYGAVAVIKRNENSMEKICAGITGEREIRVFIETEGERNFADIMQCLQPEGAIVFLSCAEKQTNIFSFSFDSNHIMLTILAEHYKTADTLLYRETVEHLLDYHVEGRICPEISAIFGFNHIEEAFYYYIKVPNGKVLIDLKDRDRLPSDYRICDKGV